MFYCFIVRIHSIEKDGWIISREGWLFRTARVRMGRVLEHVQLNGVGW